MYTRNQEDLFRHIGVAATEPDKRNGARAVRGRLVMLLQVAENLIRQCDNALAR